MSWWGHTFMVVVQEIFWDRLWESDPKKAAQLVRDGNGGEDVASVIEKMTPKAWLDACHLVLMEEA